MPAQFKLSCSTVLLTYSQTGELTKQDVERLQQSIDRVEKTLGEALNELRFDLKKIEGY